jgi:hypothetical protein
MDLAAVSWTQWVSLLISLLIMIYLLVNYKKEHLGGYASYGQIWTMTLAIGVIATIITTIYSYILMGFIDTELLDKMKLVQEQKIMNNPRIPEAVLDSALEKLDNNMTLNRTTIMGLIFGPVSWAILGLIIAAFVKKNNPADQVA